MIVYRIENRNGDGPYNCPGHDYDLRSRMRCRVMPLGNHPGPCQDGIDFVTGLHRFGFVHFYQLTDWFGYDFKGIEDCGFFIAVYDSHDVRQGKTQCAFDQRNCPKEVFRPTEFMKIHKERNYFKDGLAKSPEMV